MTHTKIEGMPVPEDVLSAQLAQLHRIANSVRPSRSGNMLLGYTTQGFTVQRNPWDDYVRGGGGMGRGGSTVPRWG